MNPTLAIVGRPNVGKSTLFNRLTRSRAALVADAPGLTRDRQVGYGRVGPRPYLAVDTGGLIEEAGDAVADAVAAQALRAAGEADAVVLVVDARAGITGADREIAARLRALGKPVHVAANKAEGLDPALCAAEFHELGFTGVHAISASHGDGIATMMDAALADFPETGPEPAEGAEEERIRVAIIGRPNVGKSTLINRVLGDERVVTSEAPGTTRDSIAVPFSRDGHDYLLVDTAGVRRRGRVAETIEKFSIVKTFQAIDRAHVVVGLLDAQEGVTGQDASLLGLVLDSGRALVVAVNKWDGLAREHRERVRGEIDRKLRFVDFASVHYVSALHGSGVGELFDSIVAAWRSAFVRPETAQLTRVLADLVAAHQPPLIRGRRIKLRYAHLGGQNPPRIIVHGNQTARVPDGYRRYLARGYREALGLSGTPVRIEFRQGGNPFEGRTNPLTARQARKRRRLIEHARRHKRR